MFSGTIKPFSHFPPSRICEKGSSAKKGKILLFLDITPFPFFGEEGMIISSSFLLSGKIMTSRSSLFPPSSS